MIRLGVLGWPVGHSRSPAMQNAALRASGLTGWRYQLLPVPPQLFDETAKALPGAGFRGANVTIPHKEASLKLAARATERARAIGAANTLTFGDDDDGGIEADNTDAPGLIAALPFTVAGRSAVVLGAGGSARAAVWALLDAGAADVRVWNRTPERAERLCATLGGRAVDTVTAADLLVNCTPAGLDKRESQFKQLPIQADAVDNYECVVDFVYSDSETPLARAARDRSIPVIDGLELLVQQGALSFARFTGLPAPIDVMRAAARRG